ncbi:3-(3-hydroxyphenyl)propionate hydroxylase [Mycobacterium sp. CBMA293]|uniref:FAD-dependent monooxygenase n=1 Tax=unclassified Mycolicibacterium TaxID=2636767 RepID=UPI0012DF074E|nr:MULTISPECIES: FAD-dependent monooxygenase [unclassified Mycolicibacterium]MUL45188.1 3-(3-hydroxyphenyl)propionate hydroxylase [Mycolicibacterium sp. CBMA 360]MUL56707.1 3-(3-hydroxyphenyl)propionate hydroxylase [Mycolicibacterium sp. CBMA 335]MUL69746.1 3-(3-hydroxyphenyl)propionate hydroxylase [Mycolicibacterium sp. CBMA 311]MUL91794.1 3-(3-hydroxyphenyl)propionate hydroxylase [Mycolicibacterium sp. CBMA 230]MUM05534.1 3-(3-hydroxyphenyl)propionate hydroxylase [Mycolicibacterium sp. CBMA 
MTVVIAGAGPTGLTLAIELARRGVPCRVLDQAATLFPGSRGKGLQPRTLEVFDDLGVIGAVLAAGKSFPPMRLYRGAEVVWTKPIYELLGLPELAVTPAVPYPYTWLLPQWRTDQILAARFAELGGVIEFNTRVMDFRQDDDGVTVHTDRGTIRADYLVGADGGRSTVRKVSGVEFRGGALTEERIVVGDVRATGLDGRCCHLLTADGDQSKRFSLWNLPGSEHFQLVVTTAPGEDPPALTLAGMQDLLEQRSGRRDVVLSDLRWISEYRVNLLMAQQFRMGRVLLAGDAAHVHSPAGGQGVNTGVQDAYNLGWKLAAVRSGAPDVLLDSYTAERMPVAANVLQLSGALHRQGFGAAGPAPSAIHQLDISYRGGPLAVEDHDIPGSLRAGDRAPDALLSDGRRLFDVLRGLHWTVLEFGGTAVDFGVPRVSLVPGADYDMPAGSYVLVRPDGHIATITDRPDVIWEQLRHFDPVGEPSLS